MRILIADRETKVRYALSILIQGHPGWQIAGFAGDARELLDRMGPIMPDVLLLDWNLPGMTRHDLLHCLRHTSSKPVIVMISTNPETRHAAFSEGADYFVSKIDSPHKLLEVMQECENQLKKSE